MGSEGVFLKWSLIFMIISLKFLTIQRTIKLFMLRITVKLMIKRLIQRSLSGVNLYVIPITSINHNLHILLLLLLSRFSRVRLNMYATPETAAHQAPPSMGFSRQEHWSGVPSPSLYLPHFIDKETMAYITCTGFPNGSVDKELACSIGDKGDAGLTPGWGPSPGGGNGSPFQCSCFRNPMDWGAWWATVHAVTKSWTWLSN